MGRPDWRAMLAGMTSTEYADWRRFYCAHYFQDTQLDAHFSGLMYAVLSLFFCDPEMHPADFSLLVPKTEEELTAMPDENDVLIQKAEGLAGGVRFGGGEGRDILPSADVEDVPVDDAALMMASAGIYGGVRYVPASR
ncbi:phage tail assembly protein T [Escherichia coli]|uniref:Phage tail assembly protein T n=2 Tax=Escherichia coli TaxID=562 RepID=A0AAP6AX19_ECOLX|nr:phage tail assembly protein T [Escherichia coli]ELP2895806.1 phage tail assembly protein T [Escherichia coli O128]EEC8803223.1 phage tail assembly protein T [Escherichia coli]EEQ3310878.1 phage tail assembly protein T [Escherichia coli]EEQ7294379.1 phage tail assembly protein T [Escherichia coli]EET7765205.1 phage tail assembly protein T [Escherichia coli]